MGFFLLTTTTHSRICLLMMTYSHRQLVNRVLFWIGFFIIVVCGIYILYEAIVVEMSPVSCENRPMFLTYLMGRSSLQIALCTICSVIQFPFIYRYLLLSREDRALQECTPSARDCQDTAARQFGLQARDRAVWPLVCVL